MINLRRGWLLKIFSTLAIAASAMIAPHATANTAFTADEQSQGYVNGRVLVKLRRDVSDSDARGHAAESRAGVTHRRDFRRLTGQHLLEFDSAKSVASVIKELRASGLYEFVEADRILHARVTPNDPSFAQQWSLNNTGQSSGTAGADIGAPAAWDLQSDASSVIVAIIDSGMRLTHTDLAGNLWLNPTPGSSGISGDLNGINAINNTGNPNDDNVDGHGTHVSGTIGAIGNNANSVTGVAWKVKLMPLKFLASDGSGTTSAAITCIDYAIAHGASIINASYGTPVYSASEFAAVQRARDAGIIFVAAAGNDALSTDNGKDYPAAYSLDNIVTVAATTRTDALASYSDYGSGSVDLAAPGDQILSTSNTSNTATKILSGTSMAAPHVSGALALLKARFPNDTYRQLINRLLRSTTKLPALSGKVQSGGRLNLARALASTDHRPINDDFATRAQLSGSNVLVRSSNVDATREASEPAPAGVTGGASLWWAWTAPASGIVTFDTTGSGYDTALAVYTGNDFGSLQLSGANDDSAVGTTTSSVTLTVAAGTTYQIAVDGKNAAAGLTVLKIAARPPNDSFAAAQVVTGASFSVNGTTLYGSSETGETKPVSAAAGHSVWYRWTAPATARYSLAAFSTESDLVAGVYSGTSVSSLTLVGGNDDAVDLNTDSLVVFNATAGTTYFFAVDDSVKYGSDSGTFILTLTDSLWQYPTQAEVTSSPAVVADGTIYFGSNDGFLYAVNTDGTTKWSARAGYSTGDSVNLSSPAIGADNTVYVGSTDGYLYAFNTSTGSRRWRYLTTAAIDSSPAIAADGTIYVRDETNLYALTNNTTSVTKKWSVPLSGYTYASPAIATDGTIYAAASAGNFYAINPDGSTKWTFIADGDIYTTPAIATDGTIYFGTIAGTLYALNPGGTKKWSVNIGDGGGFSSSIAIATDGTIYFGAYDHQLHALRPNGVEAWTCTLGDEVRASSPAIAADGTIYVGCYDSQVYAINPNGTLLRSIPTAGLIRSSPVIASGRLYFGSSDAKLYAFALGQNAAVSAWPMFHQNPLHNGRAVTPPTIGTQPANQAAAAGESVTLTATASGTPAPTFQWQLDGANLAGATSSAFTLANLQPANTGLYTFVATGSVAATSDPAIVGLSTTSKVVGSAEELQPPNIPHPNGNIFDQVLLKGAAATITADTGQVTRMSFIDLNDDIVQVEFAGAGSLSLVLDNPTDPAPPVKYNQAVSYMKGHAGIVVTGANETTNLTIFTVGRATAFDPTGAYNILLPVSASNNPANNGSSLFQGHATTTYDAVADIAFVAISSANGKFGGLRASDASCFATKGLTGIYAPGVQFTGPVFVSDINASDTATPALIIGSSPDTRITGGDLLQSNGQPVKVSGLLQLRFTAGQDSAGNLLSAKSDRAVLQQNGADVTAQVVVNPSP